MNAIEMAVKSVIEKTLPGMLERLAENLPPEVFEKIGQIGQIAISLKSQLDRIEGQQRLIMAHLNIAPDVQPTEAENVRRAEISVARADGPIGD